MSNFFQVKTIASGDVRCSPISLGLLTGSASRNAGGFLEAVSGLATHLRHNNCHVEVFAADDSNAERDLHHWEGVKLSRFQIVGLQGFKYAPALQAQLNAARLDVLHSHGLWTYSSIASTRWARTHRKPLIVTAHGMLDPWAVRNSRIKKRLAALFYEDAHLQQARCLHALSNAEAMAFRGYGLRNPICVIPNGLDLPSATVNLAPSWDRTLPKGAKVLLYLGRIHPKKGLRALLDGLGRSIAERIIDESWFLVVAGWDQGAHLIELRSLVDHLGLQERVRFVGPQFDDDKKNSFERADAFVLPSLSEGLPMVVLEAWSFGLPVLMTPYCNLPIGFEVGAAIAMDPTPESISDAIGVLSALSDSDRLRMGKLGRALVADMYTWDKVTVQVREMYDWALGGGPQPSSFDAYL